MRHLSRNGIIVLVVIAIAIFGLYPPSKKLRLGKDLAGGVSLVYAVNIESGNKRDIIGQIIEVLKERIDPKGVMEISLVAQGTDRIEITMPLPSQKVQELKEEFESALQGLEDVAISSEELDRLVAMEDPAEREARIQELANDDLTRLGVLEEMVTAYDEWWPLQEEFDETYGRVQDVQNQIDTLLDEGAPEDDPNVAQLRQALDLIELELRDLTRDAAAARRDYEAARAEVLQWSVSTLDVKRALNLPNKRDRLRDNATGEVKEIESPRERAWEAILERYAGQEEVINQLQRVKEAWDAYERERTTLDDAEDLKRLVRGAGVLDFRITVNPGEHPEEVRLRSELRELGPKNAGADDAQWFKINKLRNWIDSVQQLEAVQSDPAAFFRSRNYVVDEFNGELYMLAWDTRDRRLTEAERPWELAAAYPTTDQQGRIAIGFTMNQLGGEKLGRLTGDNEGKNMAILLDDEVYTAPRLNSRITTRGIIEGTFRQEEIDYIVRVLSAGSLQAKLSPDPISENTLAPTLGADNLRDGLRAGVIALAAVSGFMLLYYFFGGGVAVVGLMLNALILLGAMALNRAAFTLPGIAGIVLTFGIAVDANVLIYERIREELNAKADLRTAVRLGYQRALSSIVDGNITNLIVCVVLGFVGTPEIKGFALTLGIGVVSTLFTALFVSRLIFSFVVDEIGARGWPGRMLPIAIPAIDRILTPSIDWLRLRGIFLTFSAILLILTGVVVFKQKSQMLGTEFLGGTEMVLVLREAEGAGSDRVTLTREEVEQRVQKIGEEAGPESPLFQIQSAEVVAVGPEADGVTSDTFRIRTTITDSDLVEEALQTEFRGLIDAQPPLDFVGAESEQMDLYARPVLERRLSQLTDLGSLEEDVSEFVGGVGIILENLSPPPTYETLVERLATVRSRPEYSDTLTRLQRVVILQGSEGEVRSAIVLVHDEAVGYFDDPDHARWKKDVQQREWNLVNEALSSTTSLAGVQSFSPAIARTFVAQAIVAILLSIVMIVIYVWVRFGSLRYSLAAILTTLHDVVIVVGLIGLAEIIYESAPDVANALMIRPFKIDLNLIAAILTILGYSLNDTIIVMDRIRENRGKLLYASREVVNLSINQTISRTVITSGTTLLATFVLYIWGGEGVREFAYALLLGLSVGTYSSIAIASPLVWSGKSDKSAVRPTDIEGVGGPQGT